jgi:lipoate-protein ligase B
VGERKLASIGIAVRRWVSYHGFALNVCPDLGHFDLIHPCGLKGVRMTSMAELLGGSCPGWEEVLDTVSTDVAEALGYGATDVAPSGALAGARWSDTARGIAAAAHRGLGSGIEWHAPQAGGQTA